jgi:hypothetical protein
MIALALAVPAGASAAVQGMRVSTVARGLEIPLERSQLR